MTESRLEFAGLAEPDIERSVLAAAMMEPQVAEDVFAVLDPADFHLDAHRLIAEAVKELALEGSGADLLSVTNYLRRNSQLERAGGAAFVSSLLDLLPDIVGASTHHARIVREMALRRRLGALVTRARHACIDQRRPIEQTVNELVGEILDLVDDGPGHEVGFSPLAPAVDEYVRRAFAVRAGERPQDRITTGIADLDRRLSIEPGSLTVLAGGTGAGKTALGMQVAAHCAQAHGPVAVFSLEVGRRQLAGRVLAAKLPAMLRLSSFNLAGGAFPSRAESDISMAADRVKELPLFVDDSPAITTSHMRVSLRRLLRKGPVSLVILDYLQLAKPTTRGRSREREVAEISAGLLAIARELDVPVLALSQLSRAHQHERREPQLHDLRESGSLEQDSSNVLMLGYPKEEGSQERSLYVRKQRSGPTFAVRVTFDSRAGVFLPVERRPE